MLGKEINGFEKVVSSACLGIFSPQDNEDLRRRGFRVGVLGERN